MTTTTTRNTNKHNRSSSSRASSWLRRRKAAALATIQWRRSNTSSQHLLGPHLISRKNERRFTTIAFTLVVLTTLLTTDEYFQSVIRRLKCAVPRPYVTVGQALTLPQHPNLSDVKDASHISLCREYIRRSALSPEEQPNEPMFYLQEDMNVCYDWGNPHAVLMELFASSLVAKMGSELGLVYNHDCRRALPDHAMEDSSRSTAVMGKWDSTSAQQLLASSLISNTDVEKLNGDSVLNLCRGCIAESDARSRSGIAPLNPHSTHQCLLFPGSGSTENSRVALASVLPSITKRLRHMSTDWIEKTDPLPYEDEEGVIVFLDDTSILMHYSIYNKNIPDTAKKLQILATASCAHASVTQNNNCIEHGRRVKRFMMLNRPEIYVRYDVVASTAASYARMIAVKTLICPPGTHSCLLPALAKNPGTDAIIAEAASSHATFSWFGHVMDAKKEQAESEGGESGEGGASNLDVLTLQEEELEMSLEEIGEKERAVVNPIEDNEMPAKEIDNMPVDGTTIQRDGVIEPEVEQEVVRGTAPEEENDLIPYEGGGQEGPALVQEGEYPMVDFQGYRTEGGSTMSLPSQQQTEGNIQTANTPTLTTEGNLVISGGDTNSGQTIQMNTEGNLRGRDYSSNNEGNDNNNVQGEWTEEQPPLVEGERPAPPLPQEKGVPVPIDDEATNQEDWWNRRNRQRRDQEQVRRVAERQEQRRQERVAARRDERALLP